jgi:hypothetical protein
MNLIVIVTIVPNKINVKNIITTNLTVKLKNAVPKSVSLIASQRNAILTLKNANLNAAPKNVKQKNAK